MTKKERELVRMMECWSEDVKDVLRRSGIVSLEGVYEDGGRVQWGSFDEFIQYYWAQREWLPAAEMIIALADRNPERQGGRR